MDISIASASVRTDLNRLSKLIQNVQSQKITFQDIDKEPTTAKRQLMLASLILKYIDNSVPIRLLIAECDHPATILSALYFAKQFGINKHKKLFARGLGLGPWVPQLKNSGK